MASEIVRTIKQTEQQAEDIRQAAMSKAREIVSNAEDQGVAILQNRAKEAEEEGKQIIAKKKLEAEGEIERLRQEKERNWEELTSQARSRKDRASSWIMERIVRSYGNN